MGTESIQFHRDADRLTHDLRHRGLIQKALGGYYVKRDEQKAKYTDWQEARTSAAAAKYEAVNHLDKYLLELTEKLEARGIVGEAQDTTRRRSSVWAGSAGTLGWSARPLHAP